MSKNGMMAAVAAAAGIGEEQAESLTIDAAFLAAHFPDAAATLRSEGAEAEHKRIAGIDAAAMPGHEAIIAAHKADRGKTPADAALAVIAAERTKLASMNSSLYEDEKKMHGLRSATDDIRGDTAPAASPTAQALSMSGAAQQFITAEAAKGRTVSVAEAVAHISRKG